MIRAQVRRIAAMLRRPATTMAAIKMCIRDSVNIPVGEVFTSPQLAGTNGLLHVSQVYLNELKYVELKVWFKDGRIENWSCGNFADDEANRNYFFENVMYRCV